MKVDELAGRNLSAAHREILNAEQALVIIIGTENKFDERYHTVLGHVGEAVRGVEKAIALSRRIQKGERP